MGQALKNIPTTPIGLKIQLAGFQDPQTSNDVHSMSVIHACDHFISSEECAKVVNINTLNTTNGMPTVISLGVAIIFSSIKDRPLERPSVSCVNRRSWEQAGGAFLP